MVQGPISDEDVFHYEQLQQRDKEHVHGQLAIEAARLQGIFSDVDRNWEVEHEDAVDVAMSDVDTILDEWRSELEQMSLTTNDSSGGIDDDNSHHYTSPTVTAMSMLHDDMTANNLDKVVDEGVERLMSTDVENLNDDQRRAFDIVDWHLNETLEGKQPPQLLMMIPGEGGVGKSKLIQTMTRAFQLKGVGEWCVKGAYTGIAASLIDGSTLHVLASIPVHGGKQSAQTMKKLREFWRTKRYLIIDEISMLSRSFFAKLCRIISTAMERNEDIIFGGLNVVIVGDFHQFPPVVARKSAPLYCLADPLYDSEDDVLGREIYEQFTTVVQLKQQIRVKDEIWQDVLQHVRHGNCSQYHIDIIKKLIITDPQAPPTDYSSQPWKDARLVTPRHAVRMQWNSAAVKKHCKETHHRLYLCPAEDMVDGRPVTNDEKIAIATRTKGSKSTMERAGLMKDVELAIGAPVMVTLNIHTELDVTNGVRGVIEGIVLDERERQIGPNEHMVQLRYPPRYVLVKLLRTKAAHLRGLAENVIPISPVCKGFAVMKDGVRITAHRTQLPLTLAYAFTDYRSQGQSLKPVLVDIGTPPNGRLTPFNIYVALSRGTGRDNIRLLRDFDERLLQQHPSEYLRLEDHRLQDLNDLTKQMWEKKKWHGGDRTEG